MQLVRAEPWQFRLTLRLMGIMVHYAPQRFITQGMTTLPARDQAMLALAEFQKGFIAMIREALRNGSQRCSMGYCAHGQPLGFPPTKHSGSGPPLAW